LKRLRANARLAPAGLLCADLLPRRSEPQVKRSVPEHNKAKQNQSRNSSKDKKKRHKVPCSQNWQNSTKKKNTSLCVFGAAFKRPAFNASYSFQ